MKNIPKSFKVLTAFSLILFSFALIYQGIKYYEKTSIPTGKVNYKANEDPVDVNWNSGTLKTAYKIEEISSSDLESIATYTFSDYSNSLQGGVIVDDKYLVFMETTSGNTKVHVHNLNGNNHKVNTSYNFGHANDLTYQGEYIYVTTGTESNGKYIVGRFKVNDNMELTNVNPTWNELTYAKSGIAFTTSPAVYVKSEQRAYFYKDVRTDTSSGSVVIPTYLTAQSIAYRNGVIYAPRYEYGKAPNSNCASSYQETCYNSKEEDSNLIQLFNSTYGTCSILNSSNSNSNRCTNIYSNPTCTNLIKSFYISKNTVRGELEFVDFLSDGRMILGYNEYTRGDWNAKGCHVINSKTIHFYKTKFSIDDKLKYTVTLNGNTATSAGSTSTKALINDTKLSSITNPKKVITITYNKESIGQGKTIDETNSYQLDGWYTEAKGGTKVASSSTKPALQSSASGYTNSNGQWIRTSNDSELYAHWKSGVEVTLPKITKTGYDCVWQTDDSGIKTRPADGTGKWTFSSRIEREFVISCIEKTIKVTFNKNGATSGTDNQTQTFTYGVSGQKFSNKNLSRTGYTQSGWNTKADGTGSQYSINSNVSDSWINNNSPSITLYATWTSSSDYTITYDLDGGEVLTANPTSYNVDSNTITLNNPTKTGYTFVGWSGTGLTGNTNTLVKIPAGSTGNRSYTANWRINKVYIQIDMNGGSLASAHGDRIGVAGSNITVDGNINVHSINYNGKLGVDGLVNYNNSSYINIVKAGYSAPSTKEWVNKNDSSKVYNQAYSYNASDFCNATTSDCTVVLKVNWNIVNYSINYNLNGGSVSDNPTTYNVNTSSFTLNNPTRVGYTFIGWSGTGISGTSDNVSIPTGSTGNRAYTANWETKKTIVYLEGNGGYTDTWKAYISYGDTKLSQISTPTRKVTLHYVNDIGATVTGGDSEKDYVLQGWYTAKTGGTKVASGSTELSYEPVLEKNVEEYTNASGEWIKLSNSTIYAQWKTTAQLPKIEKEGYTCVWTTDYEGIKTIKSQGTWTFTGANERTFTASCVQGSDAVVDMTITKPSKLVYNVGETLDLTGGKVNLFYEDETKKITLPMSDSNVSVTGFDSSTAGTKTIRVSYTDHGTTFIKNFTVKVEEVQEDLELNVNYSVNDTYTEVTISSGNGTSLKELDGWDLNGTSLSKKFYDTENAFTVNVCDIYNECINVFVNKLPIKKQEISFSKPSVVQEIGKNTYTQVPNLLGNANVVYESSNENIASVDNSGKVTIKKSGTVIITAISGKTDDYYQGEASYILSIIKMHQSLEFTSTIVNKKPNSDNYTLEAVHSLGDGQVTYESTNPEVATVDNNGEVTILSNGTTNIVASASETEQYFPVSASYTLNVLDNPQDIYFDDSSIIRKFTNQKFKVKANINSGFGNITYTSSNEDVATIDENGEITFKGLGKTIIVATAAKTEEYDETSASFILNVEQGEQIIAFEDDIKDEILVLEDAKPFKLPVILKDGDATLKYTSSDLNVATIAEDGTVTIKGKGVTTITITAEETDNYMMAINTIQLRVNEKKSEDEVIVPDTANNISLIVFLVATVSIAFGLYTINKAKQSKTKNNI